MGEDRLTFPCLSRRWRTIVSGLRGRQRSSSDLMGQERPRHIQELTRYHNPQPQIILKSHHYWNVTQIWVKDTLAKVLFILYVNGTTCFILVLELHISYCEINVCIQRFKHACEIISGSVNDG